MPKRVEMLVTQLDPFEVEPMGQLSGTVSEVLIQLPIDLDTWPFVWVHRFYPHSVPARDVAAAVRGIEPEIRKLCKQIHEGLGIKT